MKKLKITRQTFLKATAATGVAASLYSPEMPPLKGLVEAKESAAGGGGVRVLKSSCRGCHGGCWTLVHVRDGRVVKVEPDPEGGSLGTLCALGLAATQRAYHPDRIKYPMKRVGKRGEGKWLRVSWDEALDTIAKKFNEIKEKYGPEFAMLAKGTGRDVDQAVTMAVFKAWGMPHAIGPGLICHTCATNIAETMGVGIHGRPPAGPGGASLMDANLGVIVGANVAGFSADVKRAKMRKALIGKKIITFDPDFDHVEASQADIWLPVRPGTDCAWALAWLNVIIDEDLYDHGFVEQWTNAPFLVVIEPKKPQRGAGEVPGPLLTEADMKLNGKPTRYMVWDEATKSLKYWDATPMPPPSKGPPFPIYVLEWEAAGIKPALFGTYKVKLKDGREVECKPTWQILWERIKEWTPEKAAEVTWIPANKIRETARMFATTKPASIYVGVALDMHVTMTQTHRILTFLSGVTGNFDYERLSPDVPGFIDFRSAQPRVSLPPEVHMKKIGADKYPIYACSSWTGVGSVPWDSFLQSMLIGRPYKPKALMAWTTTLMWAPNQKDTWNALKEFEFIATCDIFMTPLVEISDIVLPGATWLEEDRLCEKGDGIRVKQNATGRLWEAMPDLEIGFKLSRALGIRDLIFPWETVEELLDYQLKGTGYTFAEFKKIGHIKCPPFQYPVARYKRGMMRVPPTDFTDRKPGFPTPTGKLEVYSVKLKEWGYDPIYVHYVEPPESPYSTPELAKEYPLILTTGKRTPVFYHSEYRQLPWLREIFPVPLLGINPEAATELGIKDGDWVWIESPRGRVRHVAHLTNGIHPRVVQSYQHNWWYPEKPATPENPKGVFDSNINVLMDSEHTDSVGGSTVHRGLLCKVYKAVEGAPEGIWTEPEQFKAWLPKPPGGE
ncbi:molybdopterin-dependent oxidoreductase [Chloroflexota bacterium]